VYGYEPHVRRIGEEKAEPATGEKKHPRPAVGGGADDRVAEPVPWDPGPLREEGGELPGRRATRLRPAVVPQAPPARDLRWFLSPLDHPPTLRLPWARNERHEPIGWQSKGLTNGLQEKLRRRAPEEEAEPDHSGPPVQKPSPIKLRGASRGEWSDGDRRREARSEGRGAQAKEGRHGSGGPGRSGRMKASAWTRARPPHRRHVLWPLSPHLGKRFVRQPPVHPAADRHRARRPQAERKPPVSMLHGCGGWSKAYWNLSTSGARVSSRSRLSASGGRIISSR
jgi:hypothetical protein